VPQDNIIRRIIGFTSILLAPIESGCSTPLPAKRRRLMFRKARVSSFRSIQQTTARQHRLVKMSGRIDDPQRLCGGRNVIWGQMPLLLTLVLLRATILKTTHPSCCRSQLLLEAEKKTNHALKQNRPKSKTFATKAQSYPTVNQFPLKEIQLELSTQTTKYGAWLRQT